MSKAMNIDCEQCWHQKLAPVISFLMPWIDEAACDDAKACVLAIAELFSWDFIWMCIEHSAPIKARNEFSRQCKGKNITEARLLEAQKFMRTWDGAMSSADTVAEVRQKNKKLEGELAASKLNALNAAREQAKMMLKSGMPREVVKSIIAQNPDLDAEAVVSAAELPEKEEA